MDSENMTAPDPCLQSPSPALLKALEEFNQGLYYECHDTLEEMWMAEPRPVRTLYQGILQIGVAFYHLRNGRFRPVCVLLRGGSKYLRPHAPVCMGIDVERLLADVVRCLEEVQRLGPDGLSEFNWDGVPRIALVD
jgi:predicted metal-dependent hydrolase